MIADMPAGTIKISMAELIAEEITADITAQVIGMDTFISKHKERTYQNSAKKKTGKEDIRFLQ